MKKKLICIASLFLYISNTLSAQSDLAIGSKVPDLVLNDIVNFKSTSAKISDFKDQLLILDFWATWCGPCVAEFPKLDSLQKSFGSKVQILSVTAQSKEIVDEFFSKYSKIKKIQPRPSVTGDTALKFFFKHSYLPHFVWIGRNGTVVAITDAEYVNSDNIKQYLEGTAFSLPEKRDNLKVINRADPIFSIGIPVYRKEVDNTYTQLLDSVGTKEKLVQSTFTRYIPGLSAVMTSRNNRVTWTNTTIQNLYSGAFGNFQIEFMYASRGIWEVNDSTLNGYRNDALYRSGRSVIEQNTWKKEHTFCYEVQLPLTSNREMLYEIMRHELNLYFGSLFNIEGVLEKRKVKCLALVRTSSAEKFALKDTLAEKEDEYGTLNVKVVNGYMKNLAHNFLNPLQGYFLPIVDKTGYKGKVDVKISGDLQKLEVVNAQLANYDLKLVEKELELEMVVIRDKNKK